MAARICRIIGGVLVIAIAVLQFTRVFNDPVGRAIVVALAIAAVLVIVLSEIFSYREEKAREAKQEERDRKLVVAAVAEYANQTVASLKPAQAVAPAELGMSPDDPRLYLDIKRSTDAMFRTTPFVLRNGGKDVAHSVQIQPFKLKRKDVKFAPIEIIPPGEERDSLPTVNSGDGPMNEHDIFSWLLKDWDGNGELVDEWPIPIKVLYSDFSKTKTFEASMSLVFHPIRYLLDEKHNWPPRNYEHPLWEFRNIEFKRTAGVASTQQSPSESRITQNTAHTS